MLSNPNIIAKRVRSVVALIGLFVGSLAAAAEKSAHVVSVGTCWTGFNAVVVTMDNGDLVTLGDITTDLTKAQYAAAIAAQATQAPVFYQITTSQTVCNLTRGNADWWVVGGSIY